MSEDKTVEVRIKFLMSIPLIKPYLKIDIDQMLIFNEKIDLFRENETHKFALELFQ